MDSSPRRAAPPATGSANRALYRSPFRRMEKGHVMQMQHSRIVTNKDRRMFEWNLAGLALFGLLFCFLPEIQVLASPAFAAFGGPAAIWWVSLLLSGLCAFNILTMMLLVLGRVSAVPAFNEKVRKDVVSETESPSLLRVPRDLPRDASTVPSSPFGQPYAGLSASPARTIGQRSTSLLNSPLTHMSSPVNTRPSPPFLSIYGSPTQNSGPAASPTPQKTPRSTPHQGHNYHTSVGSSSPLPDTGSPKTNRAAADRLPEWTEQLRQTLVSRAAGSPLARDADSRVQGSVLATPSREPVTLLRQVVAPDAALKELGLFRSIEEISENLRRWFSTKIIQPLHADIEAVTAELVKAKLEHLAPQSPASFSLFTRPPGTVSGLGDSIIMTAGNFARASKPQTLLDLSQKNPNDPIVQKRLSVERYLSFASLASHRVSVIRRISEMAQESLVQASRWSPSQLLGVTEPSNEDAQILIHLFCTFMDKHLPSEHYYDSQPFSSKHFVAFEECPSSRHDAIQIQQLHRQPPYFRLIAEKKIYEVYPGSHNVFHVMVFFLEYVHRNYAGFLGIGNLGSPAIDMVSVLDTAV